LPSRQILNNLSLASHFGPPPCECRSGKQHPKESTGWLADARHSDASTELYGLNRLRKEPAEVQLISAADKLYNARAILEDYREIGPRIWERFKRGRNDQIWYFDELVKVFKSSGVNRIVDELERVVNELRQVSAKEAH
jgi:hypothetical protein